MVLFAILYFFASFVIGLLIVNRFLFILPRLAKFSAAFFIGTLFSSTIVFVCSLIGQKFSDPIAFGLVTTFCLELIFIGYWFKRRKSFFIFKLTNFEKVLFLMLLILGFYIMHKTFSYSEGNFQIASNLYLDFGAHLPIIRSFSQNGDFPPVFPFYSGVPLVYHFFYDFTVALYEKLSIRIDFAFNILSALSFAGLLSLIYSLTQEIFGSKKLIGIITILLFIFNSSMSFVAAIQKYLFFDFFQKIYHNNVYFGDGPFGASIVSIFWNLNTYLNQRHLIFSMGIGVMVIFFYYYQLKKKKFIFPWVILSIIVGALPYWNASMFLAVLSLGIATVCLQIISKKPWKSLLIFCLVSGLIGLPQIFFIKSFQTVPFTFFHPGFLSQDLTLSNFTNYWFQNLGLSIFTIPIGVYFAKNKRQLFLITSILFVLPNIFQFSPQMFENHKFFNFFILLANIYTAFFIYLLFKKKLIFKTIAILLLFLLTFSGLIDFLVVKNDVKTVIPDYPTSNFLKWIKKNTDSHDVFLTTTDIYDPITLVGRQSFVGRPHYLWVYGINPAGRLSIKSNILNSTNKDELLKYLKTYNIKYIVLYDQRNKFEEQLKKVYEDDKHIVLKMK